MAWSAAGVAAAGLGSYMAASGADEEQTSSEATVSPGPYPNRGSEAWDMFMDALMGPDIHSRENFDADWYLAQNPDVAADPNYKDKPYEHYMNFGKEEGREPSDPATRVHVPSLQDWLNEDQTYTNWENTVYTNTMDTNSQAYRDTIATLPGMLQDAQEESYKNPLNVSIGGKPLMNVYPKGKINNTKDLINLISETAGDTFTSSMLAPEARYNYRVENAPNKPKIDFLKVLSDMAMATQGLRYGTPSTSTTTTTPGPTDTEQIGSFLQLFGQGQGLWDDLFNNPTTPQ